MTRCRCRHCGDDTGTSDSHVCGHCALFSPGRWVQTPDGRGVIVQARHSGGLVVDLPGIGNR